MHNIYIELIITNGCNKRCQYCDLDFSHKSFSYSNLDKFIEFLKNNKANYTINFFGGEPLLEFDKLKYFLENSKSYVNKYSIGTNGILLNKTKILYLIKNKVSIYLSVDNVKKGADIDLSFLSHYKNDIKINFINDPDYLDNSIQVFEDIKMHGFKNISFMPVFSTKKWSTSSLYKLGNIYKYIKSNSDDMNIIFFKYFNGVSIDKQFILDTDLYFYSDLDSLLWLQKQYKNINLALKEEINKKTTLFSLLDKEIDLEKLLKLYNIEDLLKLIFLIPKSQGVLSENSIIDNILNGG
ncbi:MAG: radical SAM protein [Candidatus Gracilibacteria bacterium]|nr:radical SAM protein [Candidatus Gracilibacteria bacterium]MDD2908611.1 radical SAM protein [Candidatus Gracilibacteria bacterium]